MRPLTLQTPKPMIEVLGKPILHWLIEALPSEITELIIVIGYKGDQIKKYFGDSFEGRKVTYVIQEKALGTGHALHLCKHLIKQGEQFLFILADDLHSAPALKKLVARGLGVLVKEHENPQSFGVLEVDASDQIIGIEEKPQKPKSNLVAVGAYIFDSTFFDYPMPLSGRGEYEYIEPLQTMIKKEAIVVERTPFWHPIGYPHDIQNAEEVLRKKYPITAKQKHNIPVIILAGGKGTRMPEQEKDKPKCLVDIVGKPMLQRQLEVLRSQGFSNITLALGYKAQMVIEWLKKTGNEDITYVIENEPLGTGGAIKLALGKRHEPFIAINCDDLVDLSLTSLVRHSCGNIYNVISAAETADGRTFGLIECDDQKKVCAFKEKDPRSMGGLVSIGHYYLQPAIFDGMPRAFSIEHDIFPKLAAAGSLVLHRHVGYWVTSNNAEQLQTTRDHFINIKK